MPVNCFISVLFCLVFFSFSFHSKMWDLISLCAFPCGLVILNIFSYTVWPCMCLRWRNAYSGILLTFIFCVAICYCVVGFPYALENNSLPYICLQKFYMLHFHYVDYFLCCTEAFKFNVVPVAYLFVLWCYIHEIIAKTNVMKDFRYVFFL